MVKESKVTLSSVYPGYVEGKGMKQTEIGLFPEDWKVVSLSEIGTFKNGINKGAEDFGFGSPFVNLMDVFGKNVITSNVSFGLINSNNAEKEIYNIKRGDVIFIRSSVKPSGVGKTVLIQNDLNETVYSGFLIRYRNSTLSDNFKRYCFDAEYFRNNIIAGSTVSANTNINQDTLKSLKLAYPKSLPEQEAIAEALSDADAWIESLEQLIAKKRLIKQGAMQELLSPKEDWRLKKLGEVIDVYRGGSPRPIQDFITDKLDGINWIKIGDTPSSGKYIVSANEKIIPEGEKNSRRVYPGDFLLSNSMSFGRPYILKIDGCIHDGWLVLQNYKSSFDTEFLYYLLNSKYILDQYKSKAAGSGVLNLNKEVVNTVELIIPSLTEQARIATILSDMDDELEALEAQLGKARKVKQGMMQELLTGRVRLV